METEVGHWYSVFCPSARLRQLVCWRRPKWFSYSDFWRISSFRSGKNGANSGQVVLLQGRMLFGAFASAPFGLSVGPLGTRIEPPEICSRATCLLCPFPGFQIATFGGREGRVLFAVIVELQGVGKAYHIEQHHRVKQRNAHTIFFVDHRTVTTGCCDWISVDPSCVGACFLRLQVTALLPRFTFSFFIW